jgi:hypothetical protein
MIRLIQIKALAGFNYVRADQVVAIAASEQGKCNVYLAGGVTIPCHEPPKDVIAKLEAATADTNERGPHGDGEAGDRGNDPRGAA